MADEEPKEEKPDAESVGSPISPEDEASPIPQIDSESLIGKANDAAERFF